MLLLYLHINRTHSRFRWFLFLRDAVHSFWDCFVGGVELTAFNFYLKCRVILVGLHCILGICSTLNRNTLP